MELQDLRAQLQVELGSETGRLFDLSREWQIEANTNHYSYLFDWLGRPIIQYPQDLIALQELVWRVRPTVIVETGIAHGGSLILSSSLLSLLDIAEAVEAGTVADPATSSRKVIGIDIDIREPNMKAIKEHPLSKKITMLEGSSTDESILRSVREIISEKDVVMVLLDTNHTHEHVLAELKGYGPLVTPGSYCIVYDTVIEALPPKTFGNRPWGVGDNPRTAVEEFLASSQDFISDDSIPQRLKITVAEGGYLRRIPERLGERDSNSLEG